MLFCCSMKLKRPIPMSTTCYYRCLDYGKLTDNNGRKTDFRNVIIIMTTNAGAEQMARSSIGFTQQDHSGDDMQAIQRVFTPEFRNRIDAIVQFKTLPPEVIIHVVDKFLIQVTEQLADKNVELDVDTAARTWLAERGYDKAMGARPMERLIQDKIKRALAEELLFGKLMHGGSVRVGVKDDELVFNVQPRHKTVTG